MNPEINWQEIATRLLWSLLGGAVLGFNREEHGRAAGLRTTILLCLAASFAMLLANLLLATSGKTGESFSTMDVMRLPLGILTGMGFIGAGAIVRRDDLILGVTTAATMWFVTVMGLCFGAGKTGLGLVALALGFATLTAVRRMEERCEQDHTAVVSLVAGEKELSAEEIVAVVSAQKCKVHFTSASYSANGEMREVHCEIFWRSHSDDGRLPSVLNQLIERLSLAKLEWKIFGGHS
jgi:putative Mg2+ transporter-C (MgtC) family protein